MGREVIEIGIASLAYPTAQNLRSKPPGLEQSQ
jgi:hypothetical protein